MRICESHSHDTHSRWRSLALMGTSCVYLYTTLQPHLNININRYTAIIYTGRVPSPPLAFRTHIVPATTTTSISTSAKHILLAYGNLYRSRRWQSTPPSTHAHTHTLASSLLSVVVVVVSVAVVVVRLVMYLNTHLYGFVCSRGKNSITLCEFVFLSVFPNTIFPITLMRVPRTSRGG